MNILEKMYNVSLSLIDGISAIWDWLNSPLALGFKLPLIGYVGIPSFTPVDIIGAGMVVVLLLWLINALVPVL